MTILADALFLAVSLTHLGIDILNGSFNVFLAYLSGPLALTNAALGAVSTAYHLAGALTQPLFGWLIDRWRMKFVAPAAMLWMGIFYTLAALNPTRGALVFLILAALGSGAFHPAGTMQATLIGRSRYAGRETTSTSYFFLLGQFGLFLGPLLAGYALSALRSNGMMLLAAPAVPLAVFGFYQFRSIKTSAEHGYAQTAGAKPHRPLGAGLIIAAALLVAFRSWAQQNMNVFLPKHLSDIGLNPEVYGLLTALFMGGSSLGNVAGGVWADRWGGKVVLQSTLALAALPLLALSATDQPLWLYALIPLAGALTGASHSVLVVFAQKALPGGMATSSGLALGFMFASGAVGTLISGFLADAWGVPAVFSLSALLVLLSVALSRRISL
jgi:FSR family fosmidomycin resistance protein-like MFS transporter